MQLITTIFEKPIEITAYSYCDGNFKILSAHYIDDDREQAVPSSELDILNCVATEIDSKYWTRYV